MVIDLGSHRFIVLGGRAWNVKNWFLIINTRILFVKIDYQVIIKYYFINVIVMYFEIKNRSYYWEYNNDIESN